MTKMRLLEGTCLTVLGKVSLDQNGGSLNLELNDVLAILAGGVTEAQAYLKTELNVQENKAILGGIFTLAMFAITLFSSYLVINELKNK